MFVLDFYDVLMHCPLGSMDCSVMYDCITTCFILRIRLFVLCRYLKINTIHSPSGVHIDQQTYNKQFPFFDTILAMHHGQNSAVHKFCKLILAVESILG